MTQLTDGRELWHTPAPDDKADAIARLVKFWSSATKSLLIVDYSNNLADQVTVVEGLLAKGIPVKLVLDHSQSTGKTEVPVIQDYRNLVDKYPELITLVIGESCMHKIVHDKYSVVDGQWAEYGSFNFTDAAGLEDNFFFIEDNEQVASVLTTIGETISSWILENEPQYNPGDTQA